MKGLVSFVLVFSLMPLLLACPGGRGDTGLATGPSSGDPIAFQYSGQTQVVAGSYGMLWAIYSSPEVFGGHRIHMSGPGVLMDGGRNVMDLSSSNLPNGGWYVPPETVPEEGTTVTLSMEAYWKLSQQWFRSQDFTIKVVRQTNPMTYCITDGDVSSGTVHAGQVFDSGVKVIPLPLNFKQSLVLTSSPSNPSQDLGMASFINYVTNDIWTVHYQAPQRVETAFDVTIQAIGHDPWFNEDRSVFYTVHVIP